MSLKLERNGWDWIMSNPFRQGSGQNPSAEPGWLRGPLPVLGRPTAALLALTPPPHRPHERLIPRPSLFHYYWPVQQLHSTSQPIARPRSLWPEPRPRRMVVNHYQTLSSANQMFSGSVNSSLWPEPLPLQAVGTPQTETAVEWSICLWSVRHVTASVRDPSASVSEAGDPSVRHGKMSLTDPPLGLLWSWETHALPLLMKHALLASKIRHEASVFSAVQ